ncbi:hypothetical protein [Citrifermentans bemidjiense]|uniref:hypothetical protein n=1 Tax=Citrifermentans bemidjiense TaxID=225194 RepID=UPI00059B90B8|nr:hypothetical protein [Citrifermentans bemidjiense]
MKKWTYETVTSVLTANGLGFAVSEVNNGLKFCLPEGTPLILYTSTGRVVVQGKVCAERTLATSLFSADEMPAASEPTPSKLWLKLAGAKREIQEVMDELKVERLDSFTQN